MPRTPQSLDWTVTFDGVGQKRQRIVRRLQGLDEEVHHGKSQTEFTGKAVKEETMGQPDAFQKDTTLSYLP